jgi:act minimal PKS acyl carrier protein
MTIDDLRDVLAACAGGAENASLNGDFSDLDFEELGYDSLALMETAARIEQDYGVHLPDDLVTELRTPRELLDFVTGAQLNGHVRAVTP